MALVVHEHPYIEPINGKYRIVDWYGSFKDIEFDDLDFAEKILYAIRLYKGELDNELLESKMAESYDQGYEDGKEEGYDDGFEDAKAQYDD